MTTEMLFLAFCMALLGVLGLAAYLSLSAMDADEDRAPWEPRGHG